MTELLTAAQMRAIEETAIAAGTVTGLELMERAGRGAVEAVFDLWPELAAAVRGAGPSRSPGYLPQEENHRAIVLCGPGNNGGDGFVVARLLAEHDWDVELYLYGDPGKLPPDARVNFERWSSIGAVAGMAAASGREGSADLVVDAVFGTGLTRPLPAQVRAALRHVHETAGTARFVGIDSASGVCMDSGKMLGDPADNPFHRDLVVQFHRAKAGQYLLPEAGRTGAVRVVDIGLRGPCAGAVRLARPAAELAKAPHAHKYAHGHALVLSGGAGRTGAARLAARGALRVGAGLVTLGVPGAAQMEVASQVTALMLRRVDDAGALARVLEEDGRLNALCLGPGLGLAAARADLIAAALESGRPAVLDADALTLIAQAPALFAMLHETCVLTPHAGEFARLFPDIAARLGEAALHGPAFSKIDATREAAQRAGCTVLFKGADTVIADPSGRCRLGAALYDRAAPWLATAGSGDVLAGFVAGLLARGFAPLAAAETAAWLHVECARAFGPGLIAEDIPEALAEVFRALGL